MTRKQRVAGRASLHRFIAARSGNVAMMFALLTFPMVGFVGFAVDYSRATAAKSSLAATADAAVLAALAPRSQISGASASAQDAASKAAAEKFFATASLPAGTTLNSAVATITHTGGQAQASITDSVNIETTLARVFGISTIAMGGTAAAASGGTVSPQYIDIYVLADASASMGIGATANDQQIMFNTPGMDGGSNGCTVACHATGSDGLARSKGAVLRFDVIQTAIASMVAQARTANASGGKIRIGLYTFADAMRTEIDITSNLSSVATATANMQLAGSDAGTITNYALTSLQPKIQKTYVDGGATVTPSVYVMLMTDAVVNAVDNQAGGGWPRSPNFVAFSPHAVPDPWTPTHTGNDTMDLESVNPAWCQPLKDAGATILTLETPYVIPSSNLFNSWEDHTRFDYIKNTLKPIITGNMRSCASSAAMAFSADQPADIKNAVQTMFASVTGSVRPRLTQ